MKLNIKRALAVSALAPVALAAVASSAGAVTIRTAAAEVFKDGDTVTATCSFENIGFQAYIDLKGDGYGNDTGGFDDIESIRVEAVDRDADDDYDATGAGFPNEYPFDAFNLAAEAKEIRTSYYNFPSSTSYALTTAQTGALVADGDAAFAGRNNTRKLNIQVKWTNVGEPGFQTSQTSHCGIVLPQGDILPDGEEGPLVEEASF